MAEKQQVSKELVSLIRLISFFKQLRHKDTLEKLGFFFVNELFNITQYKQCVFWTFEHDKIVMQSASGQIDVSDQSPYAQFLKQTTTTIMGRVFPKGLDNIDRDIDEQGYAEVIQLTQGEVSSFKKGGLSAHSACIFLYDSQSLIGGVWVDRDKSLGEMEKAVIEDAADALSSKLQFFNHQKKSFFSKIRQTSRKKRLVYFALLALCLWPVRFSVTASAEVVAQDAHVVSVTYNALISEVLVKPNQEVAEGDVLFTLDKTQLESEYSIVLQELSSAKERLAKTERESFIDPEKRYDINVLKGVIEEKNLAVEYAKKRLDQAMITAPKAGVVLFSDANDLIGQPVGVGDQVMVVANPEKIELLARIPADGMINLREDVPVKFFLNTSPLKSHKGQINNVSYQTVRTPDAQLTYNARIDILDKSVIERIGLTGTAKLYGGRTVMLFNLLRRPFTGLRNFLAF